LQQDLIVIYIIKGCFWRFGEAVSGDSEKQWTTAVLTANNAAAQQEEEDIKVAGCVLKIYIFLIANL